MRTLSYTGIAWLIAGAIAPAAAQDLPTCPTDETWLDDDAWLRALSLDVRGHVPSPEDHARLDAGEAPEDLLAEWLGTPEFAQQVVRHHREILWPNVTDIRLISNRQRLIQEGDVWWRYLVAPHYRGGPVYCGDFEAEWDDDGELITQTTEDGYVQEGWTWVSPYWDPENPIKMCAFGAQEAAVSPWGTECDTYDSRYDPYCGCGPNLAWCDTPDLGHNGGNPTPPVAMGIVGDIERRIAHVIETDQSYLEILTSDTMFINGPLAHFYRYQTRVPAHIRFHEVPIDPEQLPDLDFTDADTWVQIQAGPHHAGVLTSTAYLMKFQTRRARANRFYMGFLCQPFQPPDGGLDDLDDPDASLDLTQRDGCKYCHAILEPAGAHWGRWGEYGAGYLDPTSFPAFDEDCEWCALSGESCSAECTSYYVVDPLSSEEDPWVGWLDAYEFTEDRHVANIESGPSLLVDSGVVDGRLPACVAENAAGWLLGREIGDAESDWIDDLAATFSASGFDYAALIEAIVTSDRYRRVE